MWSIFPCAFIILYLVSIVYVLKLALETCPVWYSFLMIYPRTFLEGRCHLKPWWTSLTIRSPSASVLWLPCWLSGKETACIAGELQETWVWSLGWEDHPEKEIVTHSIILAWEIPWTKEPDGLQSMGLQRVGHNFATEHIQLSIRYFQRRNKLGVTF